jgi:copper chaperone CopZ
MEKTISHIYHIGGMGYGNCASTVKQKLSGVAGVTSVAIDLGKKEAKITLIKEIETDTLQHAFSNTRYTISELDSKIR